jgi:2-dehydro-3-deoxyphosphogalactonate aldolase
MPLVAILRGVEPSQILDVAQVLHEAGILSLEIPLNSPDPLASIRRARDEFDGRILIGAGTVLSQDNVAVVKAAGAQFVVSPGVDSAVIRATKSVGLLSFPGFYTASEAFAALAAGADVLKLFPAEAASPSVLRALRAVLPARCPVFPVGGISCESMAAYVAAGASGFGIGSALYRPGITLDEIREKAVSFVTAWHARQIKPL